jgi:hypothetical protein
MLGDADTASVPAVTPAPRLEALAVQFEAQHPAIARLLRQIVDLLEKAGI